MKGKSSIADQVIIALRRVIRAVDLHSRTLLEGHGLTGPAGIVVAAVAGTLCAEFRQSAGVEADPVLGIPATHRRDDGCRRDRCLAGAVQRLVAGERRSRG